MEEGLHLRTSERSGVFVKVECVERPLKPAPISDAGGDDTSLAAFSRRYVDKTLAIVSGRADDAIAILGLADEECLRHLGRLCSECKSAARLFCGR